MPFEIVRNDIVNMQVDAIVNPASRGIRVNPGVDMAIHKKAGPQLFEARRSIGPIGIGDAALTPGFGLDARYVIHAPSPIWVDGTKGEEQLLLKTYRRMKKLQYHTQLAESEFFCYGPAYSPERAEQRRERDEKASEKEFNNYSRER